MIDRDLLALLPTFLAVAEARSFTAAAGKLGQSASAVSQSVRHLEQRIGHPLFTRTTRSVALTEQGEALLARTQPALRELGMAVEAAASAKGKPTGLLRLNVPRLAMPLALESVLPLMRERYPDLAIEIFVEDSAVDIVERGFDAGIRIGNMTSPDMIAIPISEPLLAVMVAAPAYLRRHPAPASIEDLQRHNCINFRLGRSGRIYGWELLDDGKDVEVRAPNSVIVNDTIFNLTLALSGLGIAYLFKQLAQPYLNDGLLEVVLEKHALQEPPLCLYFPRYANDQPKIRVLIDALREVRRNDRWTRTGWVTASHPPTA
jgi:DNA-binding transcriptional LysR family regulator